MNTRIKILLALNLLAFAVGIHTACACTGITLKVADGSYIQARTMEWGEEFNKFTQVLTVRRPDDDSYKFAS